ncbi:MAG: hypothetical protein IPK97_11605 [Ahniella sp.]|nr:hypothetical protein [Ahniella sp.]
MSKRFTTIGRLSAGCLLACVSAVGAAQDPAASYALLPPDTATVPDRSPLASLFGLSEDRGQLATLPVNGLKGANLVIGLNADSGNPTLPWCAESSGLLRIGRLGSTA